MTILVAVYALTIGVGYVMRKFGTYNGKETTVFLSIATIGAVLWLSIILRQPLDLNDAIAFIIERVLH
ncbi:MULTISPECIES: hypothetical protein [unclassified Paenibacillus]|uniref:hypothetical protein n=1 Tax=unclassified Paenibacillus TaxID=185978 RepID=UPI0027821DC0|nr:MULTISPECIES: hypothetical protein [unclassified Paenibacillus]MDQ0899273.1 hypothetical protein [Paenibacillus sp. V4I7]MDQ0914723.1 hypothetical protein [Paenibacillus sp. V4I5]